MKISNGILKSINRKKDIKNGKLTIPDGVIEIGIRVFYDCINLISVTIPDSVTSIGERAFYGCSCLTSLTIPDSVTSIGEGAFIGCIGLTNITIPNSVTSIGERAFYGCSCLTSLTIPDSVTSIGEGAFSGCSGLTSVIIPDSVTSIGGGAFDDCSGLNRITIPNTINKIKCVKGFYQDGDKLKCRDFIYEIGKTYKEDTAKLCESGFHACTLGLDVFNYYTGDNVAYYEVELSGISSERGDDSKICSTAIKLLRKLTVAEAANYRLETTIE